MLESDEDEQQFDAKLKSLGRYTNIAFSDEDGLKNRTRMEKLAQALEQNTSLASLELRCMYYNKW